MYYLEALGCQKKHNVHAAGGLFIFFAPDPQTAGVRHCAAVTEAQTVFLGHQINGGNSFSITEMCLYKATFLKATTLIA